MKKLFSFLIAVEISFIALCNNVVLADIRDNNLSYLKDNVSSYDSEQINSPYYNKEYGRYIESIKDLPAEEYNEKIMLAPSKYIFNESAETNNMTRAVSYPSSYNSLSGISIASEDQGNPYVADTGWAFGVNDALEIYLKKNNVLKDCEFSEQHLRYAISESHLDNEHKNYAAQGGGFRTSTFAAASAYWTRNKLNGPVSESTLPYSINKVENIETLLNCKKVNCYVTDTIALSSSVYSDSDIDTRINLIKSLVMKYGAVYICYDHYDGAFNKYVNAYNNNNGCEISDGKEYYNGVVIVGWDDNYGVENFGESKPLKKVHF